MNPKQTNWKAAYFRMRSKMLGERDSKRYLARECDITRAQRDSVRTQLEAVKAHMASELKAAQEQSERRRMALNQAQGMIESSISALNTFDAITRTPNQAVAYDMGCRVHDLRLRMHRVHTAIEEAKR